MYHDTMELYIDTANIDDIREAASLGVLDGVTTNPSLIAKEGVDFHDRMSEICEVVTGPVSAEVVSLEHDGMIAEADVLIEIANNIVIKLPCTVDGLKGCKNFVRPWCSCQHDSLLSTTSGDDGCKGWRFLD